jgi:hypothetical protein
VRIIEIKRDGAIVNRKKLITKIIRTTKLFHQPIESQNKFYNKGYFLIENILKEK